jgi:cellulose biosynthesis protein BcsE
VRSWQAVLRRLGLRAPEATPPNGLGLDGLPHGLGLLPVATPVALAWPDHTVGAAWLHALVHDMLRHGPVWVLAESEGRADALLQADQLAQAHQTGQLTVWLMGERLTKSRRPQTRQPIDMASVFAEMQQAGLGPGHALLVLGSVHTLFSSSVAGIQHWGRQLGNWCRHRTRPVVFGWDAWDSAEQVLGPLRTLPGVFEHVAVMGHQPQGPVLFVDRWNCSEGPLFEMRLGLKTDAASQRLAYDGSLLRGPAQRLVEAPDQQQVIATRAALAGQRGVPSAWTRVSDLADVLAATQDAIAATVLLHAGNAQQQEALLSLVFELRRQHGRVLKIVVCETQDKLRSNVEQALLALGANAVVYREVGFARLQRLLEDMRDETFARALPADFATTRAGFMPDPLRGYLPLTAFCESVREMLARTSHKGLTHSFLRLSMQPHVAHVDAIQACLALRDGDVLSADQDALYVFMFACSEVDIDPALSRLFAIPPSELFAAQTLYGSLDGVHAVLRDLQETARKGVPDYSAYRREGVAASPKGSGPSAAPPAAVLQAPVSAPLREAPGLDAGHDAPHISLTPSVHARALARRSNPASKEAPC